MIFLGAGASAPLGIPAMKGFVKRFEEKINDDQLKFLCNEIKSSTDRAGEFIGRDITFDLESLMAVLEDVSGVPKKLSISPPTIAFISCQMEKGKLKRWNIEESRKIFGEDATRMLNELRLFIFNTCMKPIWEGQKMGNLTPLVRYYGPLFRLLGFGKHINDWTTWIFTTNWDTCLNTWADYISLKLEDGSVLDSQQNLVLNPVKGWAGPSDRFHIIPLHGSLNFRSGVRLRAGGDYEEIYKVIDPHIYFKDKPHEIEKIFIIYPLEAVGYERSVRSPYFDMLNILKKKLMSETWIFVIGFSFRNPTIASIFEEVLRERIRKNDWRPLGPKLEERAKESEHQHLKLFIIDSKPSKVMDNLKKQGFVNIQRACIPVEVKFPNVVPDGFEEEFSQALTKIAAKLVNAGIMDTHTIIDISKQLNKDYQLNMPTVMEV